MNEEQIRELADQFEATPELLPYVPELLKDLWLLGGNPDIAVDLLRPLELGPATRVLDLACGKGAIAVTIARELGWQVDGVDLFAPFIDEARDRARAEDVGELCRFEVADLRQRLGPCPPYDVVVYASVGVLGAMDETVRQLRGTVRGGGYMLIDDGFMLHEELKRIAAYEHYASHEETVHRLTCHGDRIVSEVRLDPQAVRETNRKNTAAIRRRAEQLAARFPGRAEQFRAYVARQEEECRQLESDFVDVVWMLQREGTNEFE